jgi:hypothetical protein
MVDRKVRLSFNSDNQIIVGQWYEVIDDVYGTADTEDSDSIIMKRDTKVQVTQLIETDMVLVHTVTGRSEKLPARNLCTLPPDQSNTAVETRGRKSSLNWRDSVFFVLFVLRTGFSKLNGEDTSSSVKMRENQI